MQRCRSCCMPNTRPSLHFDETGECSACRNFKNRPFIDWAARQEELSRILAALPYSKSGHNVIVPSSGGKDSTAQTLKLIELGARPLVVTASTCYLTPIGRRNIDNLARYATTIEVTPNRTVRAKLNKIGMEIVGDISLPEHMAIFSIPFQIAVRYGISAIFYGESPLAEYGGPPGTERQDTMTRRWIAEHAGLLGMRPMDFVGMDGITERDMLDYMLPSDEELKNVTAYWLGQFYPWNSRENARISIEHGMEAELPCPANWWPAENLDNAMTGIHDHEMFRKFAFGRLCSQISVDVRNGLISRDEALEIVLERDGLFPLRYAGVPYIDILRHLGVDERWLDDQLAKHTNWDLISHDAFHRRPVLNERASECWPAE